MVVRVVPGIPNFLFWRNLVRLAGGVNISTDPRTGAVRRHQVGWKEPVRKVVQSAMRKAVKESGGSTRLPEPETIRSAFPGGVAARLHPRYTTRRSSAASGRRATKNSRVKSLRTRLNAFLRQPEEHPDLLAAVTRLLDEYEAGAGL